MKHIVYLHIIHNCAPSSPEFYSLKVGYDFAVSDWDRATSKRVGDFNDRSYFRRCAHVRAIHRMRRERERAPLSRDILVVHRPRNSRFRWAGIGRLRHPPRGPLRPAAAILPGGGGLTRSNGDLTFHPRWLARCMWRPLSFGDSDKKRGERSFHGRREPEEFCERRDFKSIMREKISDGITSLHSRGALTNINNICGDRTIHWKQFLLFPWNAKNRFGWLSFIL